MTPPGSNQATTESWDGTSWTEVADLATAGTDMYKGAGTGSASELASEGADKGITTATEEWDAPATMTQTQHRKLQFK